MTEIICHLEPTRVPRSSASGQIHVLLYGGIPIHPGTAAIGAQLREEASRFGIQPSVAAMDFVSLALAVTAADTFVQRDDADNSWNRSIHVVLPMHAPQPWIQMSSLIEETLRFLSGDDWTFDFVPGGESPPSRQVVQSRNRIINLSRVDLVSLFSGGLDSTISTLDVMGSKIRPLLVSHAYRGDAQRQDVIAKMLPETAQRVAVNANPTWDGAKELSMRTRSFNFIAIAALAAQARSSYRAGAITELRVPENGLIAINAPLTPRRIGALSTRTTHPHYLQLMQNILTGVGVPVILRNPYEDITKGEMVGSKASYSNFESIASQTVSCGKWKRTNKQCGRCVPCLIRRASLYTGGVDDKTDYESPNLNDVMGDEVNRDDLVAMMTGVKRLKIENIERWVSRSGPLPRDTARRNRIVDVHRRGLTEVGIYLKDSGLLV